MRIGRFRIGFDGSYSGAWGKTTMSCGCRSLDMGKFWILFNGKDCKCIACGGYDCKCLCPLCDKRSMDCDCERFV